MGKKIFFTIGYPGSGKTTLAQKLAAKLGIDYLSADTLMAELFSAPVYDDNSRKIIIEESKYRVEDSIRSGKSVIFDGNINTRDRRQIVYDHAAKLKVTPIGIWVKTPLDIAKERAFNPRHEKTNVVRVLTEKQFNEIVETFEEPLTNENFVVVSGLDDFDEQYKVIRWRLTN
jgi:predicted kinase